VTRTGEPFAGDVADVAAEMGADRGNHIEAGWTVEDKDATIRQKHYGSGREILGMSYGKAAGRLVEDVWQQVAGGRAKEAHHTRSNARCARQKEKTPACRVGRRDLCR
jgi:hypothetical protein